MMEQDHRICFVGDSYIHGTSDPECTGWVGRISARARARGLQISCYNLGIRRETSADIAERWQQEVERRFRMPEIQTYVLFSFGINDSTVEEDGQRRVGLEETLHNMRGMLDSARRLHRTLFVGPAPIDDAAHNERIRELSPRMQEVADAVGVPYLEVFEPLVNDSTWITEIAETDGSHPSATGYRRLADRVEGWDHWWFRPGHGE